MDRQATILRSSADRTICRSWKGIDSDLLADAGVYRDVQGNVHVPYRDTDGSVVRERVEGRGRRWWGRGDGVHLYCRDRLSGYQTADRLLVCEGESDTLAAIQYGYQAVGVPGALAFQAEWHELFEVFSRVYPIGDGDVAGKEFVWRIRGVLPWARPVIAPPGADLRELLQTGRVREVDGLLADADWIARLEHAVLTAPDLATVERWLR